jgi:hypothetical protein
VEEQGKYDVADFTGELARAHENHEVGTTRPFENDHVRVWEIHLEPGQRGAFHDHELENVGDTTMRFVTVGLKH